VRRALGYLRKAQNADGGFGQLRADASNAQSTSWAVQGIVAAGANPGSFRRNGHNPISYITSLQQANGAIRYSRTSAQAPVWVTGQALTALARKPFPVKAPKRRAPVAPASAATAPNKPAKPKAHTSQPVPIAHAAKKTKKHTVPASHGQTISPAPAAQAVPQAHIAKSPQPPRRTVATTTHTDDGGHGALVPALAGLAAAALIAGAYLARRRLSVRH
jgi:hypothetical protein